MFKDLPPNASPGIGNKGLDDRANVAYEIKKTFDKICYESFVRPGMKPDSIAVQHFDRVYIEPLKVSEQPFIKISESKG